MKKKHLLSYNKENRNPFSRLNPKIVQSALRPLHSYSFKHSTPIDRKSSLNIAHKQHVDLPEIHYKRKHVSTRRIVETECAEII